MLRNSFLKLKYIILKLKYIIFLGTAEHGTLPRQLCSKSSQCPNNLACVNRTCVSPCTNVACGPNAFCEVENHAAWCRCNPGYTKPEGGKCISGKLYILLM